MSDHFSYLPPSPSDLSNHEWGKLVRDAVANLNELLREVPARDVIVQLEQKVHPLSSIPVLCINHLAENL